MPGDRAGKGGLDDGAGGDRGEDSGRRESEGEELLGVYEEDGEIEGNPEIDKIAIGDCVASPHNLDEHSVANFQNPVCIIRHLAVMGYHDNCLVI